MNKNIFRDRFGPRIKNIMLLIMVVVCMLGGCGKESVEETQDNVVVVEEENEYVYVPRVYEYDIDWQDFDTTIQWINNIVVKDDKILLFEQGYNELPWSRIEAVDMKTGKREACDIGLAKERYIHGVSATEEGYVVYSEELIEGDYGSDVLQDAFLTYYDSDFQFVNEINISNFVIKLNGISSWYYDYFVADKEGNAYFLYNSAIHVADKEGNSLGTIKLNDGTIEGMTYAGDKVLLLYRDKGNKTVVEPVDLENMCMGQPLENIPDGGFYPRIFAGEGDAVYLATDNNLYVYHLDTAENAEVVKWNDCDLNGIGQIGTASGDSIISTNFAAESFELILLDKIKKSEVKEEVIITVAMVKTDYYIADLLMKYSRMNPEYRLVPKIYAEDESPEALEAALQQFNLDLISGNIGDIVFVTRDLDFTNLASKGAFANMDELIEQDPELAKADFIENIVNTLSVDGALYGIAPYFNVNTLVGKTSIVGTESWNVADVKRILEKQEGAVFKYGLTKTQALELFLRYSMDSYYNPLTGECHFNGESFKILLELAGTFPDELDSEEYSNNWENVSEYANDVRIVDDFKEAFCDFYALQLHRAVFGEEVSLIGYPVESGSGSVATFGNGLYAISATSENKEMAWQFIRELLSEEYQCSKAVIDAGLPIRKDVFEQELQDAMDEALEGKRIYGNLELSFEPVSEADAAYIKEVIYGITRNGFTDYQILNIVEEEAGAYFSGQKSVEDVAALIQNRVQLYVDENK